MANFTSPVEATFELQRESLEQGQQAIEQGIDFQRRIGESVVSGLGSQEEFQHRIVELHRDTIHSTLDAIESLPGADGAVADLRESIDGGYDELLAGHEEAFEAASEELESGIDSYDELTGDVLDTVNEQLELLVQAHEDLEAQSVEVTEELVGQVEELQEQADDVQSQIEKVSEEAAQAVEA